MDLKDADTTLHLLGTVHMLKPDLAWRSREIDTALAAAQTVVFEIDMTGPDSGRAIMSFFSEEGMADDGRALTSRLSAAEADVFKAAAASVDLPYEALEAMEPWYAAMTLSATHLEKAGYDPASGVEQILTAEAQGARKMLVYLETPHDQLGRLADLSDAEQVGFLVSSADSMGSLDQDMQLLTSEWADGDTAGLAALLTDPDLTGSPA